MRDADEQAGQAAADQSPENRDGETVTEIRSTLPRDWQDRVGNPWT